jgi:hypothetical protein
MGNLSIVRKRRNIASMDTKASATQPIPVKDKKRKFIRVLRSSW